MSTQPQTDPIAAFIFGIQKPNDEDRLVSSARVAKILGVDARVIARLVKRGDIDGIWISEKHLRVRASSVRKFLCSGGIRRSHSEDIKQ